MDRTRFTRCRFMWFDTSHFPVSLTITSLTLGQSSNCTNTQTTWKYGSIDLFSDAQYLLDISQMSLSSAMILLLPFTKIWLVNTRTCFILRFNLINWNPNFKHSCCNGMPYEWRTCLDKPGAGNSFSNEFFFSEGLNPGRIHATPRMQDSSIWIQPRGVFRINPIPGI